VSKELALLLTVAAGGVVAAQAPANNVISHRLGDLGAVTVNFVAGTVLILLIAFLFKGGIHIDDRTWRCGSVPKRYGANPKARPARNAARSDPVSARTNRNIPIADSTNVDRKATL